MGPTAAGKTDLAVALTQRLPCDIVSVDSAMVYRGMDIGTAKPSAAILAQAPHRLIDIRDPTDAYSTADFCRDARAAIDEIHAQGRIPLLVGGTMLYFRALQQGLAALPSADPALRDALTAEAAQRGWAALHAELARLDPLTARHIHPNDPQRIQRALEVCRLSGRTMSALIAEAEHAALPYRRVKLVVAPRDRALLRERIAQRFLDMLDQGLVGEVEGLLSRYPGLHDQPAMRAVGYRQVLSHLRGDWSWEQMVERAITASRQLAKRQLTWLRAESDCHWLIDEPDPVAVAQHLIEAARQAPIP